MTKVELIIGPAGAGKTQRVLAALRAALAAEWKERRFGTTLWITPTQWSRRHVLQSLTDDQSPFCFGPRVATFEEFAEHILRSAPVAIRPLSRIAKRKLIRDLIDDLRARRKLPYFSAVAGTTGFLDLCIAFISELKRAEIWPEDFTDVIGKAGDGDGVPPGKARDAKSRELALIYETYQRRLHAADGAFRRDGTVSDETTSAGVAAGLYDAEGRFWSARTLLQEGHRGPYRELSCVVVDGFTDFSRTQYEILGSLADGAERVYVTLPGESKNVAGGGRTDLFDKSSAALVALKAAFSSHDATEVRVDLSSACQNRTVRHIAAHLFENPRETQRSSTSTGLTVMSCVRRTGELEAVAKRVKSLLLQGVAARDIVIVFRSLESRGETARAAFEEAGVPVATDSGRPMNASGVVRFVLALLDLEREDWPFRRLTAILNAIFYRPRGSGFERERDAAAVTAVLRSLNIDGGREGILAGLKRRIERSAERLDEQAAAHLKFADTALRVLSDALEVLRQPASFPGWIDRLLALAAKVGVGDVLADPALEAAVPLARFEAEAWKRFVGLIEEAKHSASLCGVEPREFDLADFRRQLLELLQGQTLDEPRGATGRVRILAAEQVRNLDVPHLFVCGMSESEFPQSRGDDCLYNDSERHRLTGFGLPLGHRARQSREEMLLFYGVVTRARDTLTLSYPSVDDAGEPLNPSPYLDALFNLFEQPARLVETHGGLDPVPKSLNECSTPAELRIFATSEALRGRAGLFAALAQGSQTSPTALNIVAAAEMAAARFEQRGLTCFEGMLRDPRNRKRLRSRFGVDHQFSATELETYAENPFRFFLTSVLGLQSIREPGPGTDHAHRGSTMHRALSALHRRLADDGAALAEPNVDLVREEIERALPLGGDTPLQRTLRHIEREILRTRADRYCRQWTEYLACLASQWDASPRPARFEIPFGDVRGEEGDDPSERCSPLEFGSDGELVRVCGRIDRVDVGAVDGQPVFNVIDYKMSRKPRRFEPADVECGHVLQLLIYSIAVRQLGMTDGDLYQFGYWSLDGDGFVCGLKQRAKDVQRLEAAIAEELEDALRRALPKLVKGIREGAFPIVVEESAASYHREYDTVARLTSFRPVAEVLGKTLADRPAPAPASAATADV